MNIEKYEKMDKFVDEMNASINSVGDMSVYLFNRFREFVGYLFIGITTIAIAFIVAEFVRDFDLKPIYGVDIYYITLTISLIFGIYIAFYGEEAKIATIKGAIFSSGNNRFWQVGATLVIVAVLILVNAKGVQKISDFSLRYMNQELEQSVVFKLKEKKIENHTKLSTTNNNISIGDQAVKVLMLSRADMQKAKQKEIDAIQQAADTYIKGRDPHAYRTLIARKKVETAKLIAKVEKKWAESIAKIDWKIQKAEEKINNRIIAANALREKEMKKADDATEELISHYKNESQKNTQMVEKYKHIGLIVAIGGEVIDGLLAFMLFMIIKSNPNVNGTLEVQKNTRQVIRFKSYQKEDAIVVDKHYQEPSIYKNNSSTPKKEFRFQLKDTDEPLKASLFEKIKKISAKMAEEKGKILYIENNPYIQHPTQREIIARFKEYGENVTPLQIGKYISKMGNSLIFVNQKVGFVYADAIDAVA